MQAVNPSNNICTVLSTNIHNLFTESTEMELVILQPNAQIMEVQLVAIVLLGKCTKIEISMPWIMRDFISFC